MYKYMSKWIHKLPHFVFIQFSHSAFTFFPLELALHENRTARGGLTYKPELQELPSLWLDSLNVYECVSFSFSFFFFTMCIETENPALAKMWILTLSEVATEVCVGVCCCWWTCQSPDSSNTTVSGVRKKIKKLMGIYTPALLHKSLHACSPFYLCRISSLFMTVIDMLINMFIALIIITIILP